MLGHADARSKMPRMRSLLVGVATSLALASSAAAEVKVDRVPCPGQGQCVRLANGTDFGLVAGVWTRDGARQLRMAHKLHCGQVFVNNYGAAGGVELPFGGVKSSGFGREKGFEALLGFTTLKTIAIKHG
jgi:hypothetical protein